jgi:membrane protein YdbS with pleckstrin-like domain
MEPTIYRISGAWVIASIVFWLAAAVIGVATVIVPTLSVILIIRALLLYASTRVTLDEHGVTLKRGLIVTNEQRLPLASIQSVSTSVNPIGNWLDYGTIALAVGNDHNHIKITNLSGCADLKQQLERHTHQPAITQ